MIFLTFDCLAFFTCQSVLRRVVYFFFPSQKTSTVSHSSVRLCNTVMPRRPQAEHKARIFCIGAMNSTSMTLC